MWDGLQTSAASPAYRLMILRTNETVAAIWKLNARDDNEAIATAKAFGGRNTVELWDGLRFIKQFRVGVAH